MARVLDFKKDKGRNILDKSVPDYMITTGKLFVDVQSQIFKYPKDRVIDLGYPRNDYMYKKISRTQLEFRSKWGMNDKKKIFYGCRLLENRRMRNWMRIILNHRQGYRLLIL